MYKILDISYHQKGIVLKNIKNADGYIFRAAIGSSKIDDCVEDFIFQANSINMPYGFYTASYAKDATEADNEGEFAAKLAIKNKQNVRLPIFFDFEYFSSDYILKKYNIVTTKQLVWALTEAFCEKVKEYGFTAGVYTNLDYYNRFYTKEFFDKHPDYWFWYARPSLTKPDKTCDIWQYASNNGLNDFNYNGNIDKNIMYKDFLSINGDSTNNSNTNIKYPDIKNNLVKYRIGYASNGDLKTIIETIHKLGVDVILYSKTGYISTEYLSSGDQKTILDVCKNLNVPCSIIATK